MGDQREAGVEGGMNSFILETPYQLTIIQDICMQGGRGWQPFGEGKNGHKIFRQTCIYYFVTNALFLRCIANFTQLICN